MGILITIVIILICLFDSVYTKFKKGDLNLDVTIGTIVAVALIIVFFWGNALLPELLTGSNISQPEGYMAVAALIIDVGIILFIFVVVFKKVIKVILKSHRENKIQKLKNNIAILTDETLKIEEQLNNRQTISQLIDLLEKCGADVEDIEKHPEVRNISELSEKKQIKQDRINQMELELNRYESLMQKSNGK